MTPRVWVGRVKDGLHPFLSEMFVMYKDTLLNNSYRDLLLPLHILVVEKTTRIKEVVKLLVQSLPLKLISKTVCCSLSPCGLTAMLEPIAPRMLRKHQPDLKDTMQGHIYNSAGGVG